MSGQGAGQLASPLDEATGGAGLLLSATREIEPGARVMLVQAEGLFRLDGVVDGDTLRVLVRNFSGAELRMGAQAAGPEPMFVVGDVARYEPGQGTIRFTLGEEGDRVSVQARVAILRVPDQGTVRLTGQAVVRQPPAA